MDKQNVLIINRMNVHHYYKNGEPIIDREKYNTYIITNKNKVNQFPLNDYSELYSFNIDNSDERIYELANYLHKTKGIHKVIALDETQITIGAKIRSLANVNGLQPEDAEKVRNKVTMKQTLREFNIRIPYFERLLTLERAAELLQKYQKVVIKPISGLGSESTFIISDINSLKETFQSIENEKYNYEIEEYIDGLMYHIDSIVKDGSILLSSVSRYESSTLTYKNGGTSLASYMIDNSELKEALQSFNKNVIKALKMDNCISHLEVFQTNKGELIFCEIGARTGGAGVLPCIVESFNVNLYETHIKLELEEEIPQIKETGKLSAWIIFYGEEGSVKNISYENIIQNEWVIDYRIFIKEGDSLSSPKHSTDSIASFIITAPNEEILKNRINLVQKEFNVSYV